MYYIASKSKKPYGIETQLDFYQDDKKIGFCILVNPELITYKHITYIWYIEVKKQYRNQGYGKQVFSMVVQFCKDTGLIYLHVQKDKQKAQYIYKSNGFKVRYLNPTNNMYTMYRKG